MAERSAKVTKKTGRERAIELIEQRLLRKGKPRLQMTLILTLTGAAGFLISFALLHIGITWMWLRYPIAILLAYCVFLLLLRFWLFSHSRERGSGFDIDPSLIADMDSSIVDLLPSDGASSTAEVFKLGGATDFGGGGAGGSWAEGLNSASAAPQSSGGSLLGSGGSGGGSGGSGSSLGLDLDLDEGWLIILALVFILGGIIASLYVVYIAPALLAEILVDGLLLTGLYKRMKGMEQSNWLRTAVRKTLLAALVVAFFFSIAGYLFQKAVPRAHSIGDVWTSRTDDKR
ncbi:MAG TPA: hypothetical protein VF658_19685 [Pyrinomonadaceae bacterium]|jgi:hypothetical protein